MLLYLQQLQTKLSVYFVCEPQVKIKWEMHNYVMCMSPKAVNMDPCNERERKS